MAIICLLCAIQCGGSGKKSLTFSVGGAPNELDFWEHIVAGFQAQTGVRVTLLRQPTDTDQRRQGLMIPLNSKQRDPDVFLMDIGWIGQFAAAGWLEPVDAYVLQDTSFLTPFFERIINQADVFDGKLIGLPVYIDAGLLYYRKDLLQKYGFAAPPKTWEELAACARRIQAEMRKAGIPFYGFVWQGAQYEGLVCNYIEYASSNNGGIAVENGRISVNTPANTAALTFMRDLIHRYRVSPPNIYTEMKEEEVRACFQRSEALFERNWPYAWALHQQSDSKVRGKVSISVLPHFPGGSSAATLGGWHIGISRFSDAKEAAWQFIRYVTSFEIQKKLALKLGWNPGRADIYADPEVREALPHMEVLKEVFTNAVARPALPYYTHISEIMQKYLNAALAGKMTPGDALINAQGEIDKIVVRYGAGQPPE